MAKNFVVNGFVFETMEAYHDAQKEAEAISYIRARSDLNNSTTLVKLYNKLIDKQTFITPVGVCFLKELYDTIIERGIISKENLRPVPVKQVVKKQTTVVRGFAQDTDSKSKLLLSYTEGKLKKSRIVTGFLIVVIVAMFLITILGDYSPFIDADIRAQDRYASWEEELTQREKDIRQKEKELGIINE